jgi:hypothetical protein
LLETRDFVLTLWLSRRKRSAPVGFSAAQQYWLGDVVYGSIVLQNSFWGCVQIFPGALVRSLENYVGGSHEQSDFRPAAFVSSLQGIVSPKIHFDGQIAKFFRTLIFEFCNTIGHKQTRRWLGPMSAPTPTPDMDR